MPEDEFDRCAACNRPICYDCPYQETPKQLCPFCQVNYIEMDEIMCEECEYLLGITDKKPKK